MGLVAQVFDEPTLSSLRGHVAVGHCRYSTTGSSVWENAQPTFRSTATGSVALAHNGNLINTRELQDTVDKRHAEAGELPFEDADGRSPARAWLASQQPPATTDTDLVAALFASYP